MNPKAEQYKKRQAKEVSFQTEANTDQLGKNQQMITALAIKMYSMGQEVILLKKRLDRADAIARYADYRSSALSNLLRASGTYSESDVLNQIEALQTNDFDLNSAAEDEKKNLTSVTTSAAADGMYAIFSVKIFMNGDELISEKIIRSKLLLGDEEDMKQTLPGIHEAILGMNVGETKRIPMNLQDKTDEAEISLLGLRTQTVIQTEQGTSDEQSNG